MKWKAGGLKNLQVLLDEVDAVASEKVVNAALEVHEMLRSNPPTGTPIDTGWASSNWTLSLDKPVDTVVGTKFAVTSEPLGIAAALQFDIRQNTAIYCTNNVPYIARLNDGWSKQSPRGFVDAAIDAIQLKYGKVK